VFDFICNELLEHGFEWELSDVPAELDVLAYCEKYNRLPNKIDPYASIIKLAMTCLDKEWEYYDKEWS
jgi:hypothetical protein